MENPDLKDNDSNVRVAAVERLTDQTRLAKVALEDKDFNVRRAAVKGLTDQMVLARVALEDKDSTVRCDAIKKLTDQSLLAKIALEDNDSYIPVVTWEGKPVTTTEYSFSSGEVVEVPSVEHYTRENHKVMKTAAFSDVRTAAVKRIADQVLLAKFALEDEDYAVRRAAVAGLTDQMILAKVALEDKDSGVRCEAIEKLKDQTLLTKIAAGDNDCYIPVATWSGWPVTKTDYISGEKVEWPIAGSYVGGKEVDRKTAAFSEIRAAAVTIITDQALLAKFAFEDKNADVRVAAIKKLTNQEFLKKIALKEEYKYARIHAVEKITDQAWLAKFALEDKEDPNPDHVASDSARGTAVVSLTDQKLLEKLALDADHSTVRCTAIAKLMNQELLAKIALESRDVDERICAVGALTNQALLVKAAMEDKFGVCNGQYNAIVKLHDMGVLDKAMIEKLMVSKYSDIRELANYYARA